VKAGRLSIDVVIAAPPDVVWQAVTDWPAQSDWMLATTVRTTKNDGRGLGGQFEAFSGIGKLGVLDTMVVTEWQPPHRVVVEHTGALIRGLGIFEVFALPDGRSRFVWGEELVVPLGAAGRAGWALGRPLVAVAVRRSLELLRRSIESKTASRLA
jgi:hypothetical protein